MKYYERVTQRTIQLVNDSISKNGAEASLARLIKIFMPYIQKRAAGISIAGLDADDLVQEGYIGLFRAMQRYDDRRQASFSTYAITCINNSMTSAIRQTARKKHLPLSGYLSLDEDDTVRLASEYTPEELAIANEEYAALQNNIQHNLSDFERDVLALYLEGYDYLAVAQRLDTTPKSVDNALQRARKKLKPRQKAP